MFGTKISYQKILLPVSAVVVLGIILIAFVLYQRSRFEQIALPEIAQRDELEPRINELSNNFSNPIVINGLAGVFCTMGQIEAGNLMETLDENTQGVQIGDISVRIWAPCYFKDSTGLTKTFNLPLFARKSTGEAYLFNTSLDKTPSEFWQNDVMAHNSLVYNIKAVPGTKVGVFFVLYPNAENQNDMAGVKFAGQTSQDLHSSEEVRSFFDSQGNLDLLGLGPDNFVMPASVMFAYE